MKNLLLMNYTNKNNGREIKAIKKNQMKILELKNSVSEILKNFTHLAYRTLEITKERLSELEGRSMKIAQFEVEREKVLEK